MEEKTTQETSQSSSENMLSAQASTSLPKPNYWKVFSLVVLFLILSGGLVFAGLYVGKNLLPNNSQQAGGIPTAMPTSGEIVVPTGSPVEEAIEDEQVKFFPKPIKVDSLGLLTSLIKANLLGMGPATPDPKEFDYEGNSTYYKIGIIKVPEYKDMELYLVDIKNVPGMFTDTKYENFIRFIKNGDTLTLLDKNSNLYLDESQGKVPANLVLEKNFEIKSLVHVQDFNFNYKGADLMFTGWNLYFEPFTDITKIGKVMDKDFYMEKKGDLTSPTFRQIGKTRKFYLKFPDTTLAQYTLAPNYISNNPQKYLPSGATDFVPVPANFLINWTDGASLKQDPKMGSVLVIYNLYNSEMTIPGGNGKITYYDKTIDLASDLILIGTNPAEEEFFGLKDKNHIIYKDFYANRNDYSDFTKNMTYDEFVAQRPMFFWKDLFGDYHAMFRGDFEIAAGIAKPAVYLYPEKEATVTVAIDKSLVNVITIPDYRNEWRVTAKPNGEIVFGGKTFDYLFYEGDKRGFVFSGGVEDIVKRENVGSYLEKKLAGLGLNFKERNQFKEYWVPRMQKDNYYEVSFMGTEELQKEVPLYVSPKPETLIRILMKFTGKEDGIERYSFESNPSERIGFTAVEWGGLK